MSAAWAGRPLIDTVSITPISVTRISTPPQSLPGLTHGCPVRFLWTGCMTWILLRFERFAHVRDTEGTHAMRHQNIVFHGTLKYVPWHKLEQSVEKHGADDLSRSLTTKLH